MPAQSQAGISATAYVCANRDLGMAAIIGFQSNTTITSAFWIYKPDPLTSQAGKETFVEVNNIQYIEANLEVLLGNIVSTSVANNILTVNYTSTTAGTIRNGQVLILSGLTTSTFLNGALLTVSVVSPTSFNAVFVNANYSTTADTGDVVDTTHRQVSIYYAETSQPSSQTPRKLEGVVAARFIYDMEVLFS